MKDKIEILLIEQLPDWELVPSKKISEKGFRIRQVGNTFVRVARIKDGKVEIISG